MEALVLMAEKVMGIPERGYTALAEVDAVFEKIEDSRGNLYELSHATYESILDKKTAP